MASGEVSHKAGEWRMANKHNDFMDKAKSNHTNTQHNVL